MIEFAFDERRAAQAAAKLLERHGRPMSVRKLVTLLYLADRRAFLEAGYPITGDRFMNAPDGPSLDRVARLLDGEADGQSPWRSQIASADGFAAAEGWTEPDELSDYDEQIAEAIHDEFCRLNDDALFEHARGLPEWTCPSGAAEAFDPRVILRAQGHDDRDIEDWEERARAFLAIHATLRR